MVSALRRRTRTMFMAAPFWSETAMPPLSERRHGRRTPHDNVRGDAELATHLRQRPLPSRPGALDRWRGRSRRARRAGALRRAAAPAGRLDLRPYAAPFR